MSKKKDPIVAVLNYFTTVDLALALQGLALAREIVRNRSPRGVKPAAKKKSQPTGRADAAPTVTN
jgi:hypothetical protein